MTSRTQRLASPSLAFLLLALVALAPHADAKKSARSRTFAVSFAPDSAGALPAGATIGAGAWRAVPDSASASAEATGGGSDSARASVPAAASGWHLVQSQSDDPRAMNSIRFARPALRDGEVSVRFRILDGALDPSVGLLLLMDPKGRNGYLVRVSGASEEAIAHYILNGRRRDLKFAPIEAPGPGAWHTLAVRRDGITLHVLYDGAERMSLRDERFREGTVGLWTEADTAAEFADLNVTVR